MFLTTRLFHRVGFPAYRKIRESSAAISAHVAESITGVRVVQAFNAEQRALDELEVKNDAYRGAVMRGAKIASAYQTRLAESLEVAYDNAALDAFRAALGSDPENIAAAKGYIDDVIDPRDTRIKVASALQVLRHKSEVVPPKKHGSIPL